MLSPNFKVVFTNWYAISIFPLRLNAIIPPIPRPDTLTDQTTLGPDLVLKGTWDQTGSDIIPPRNRKWVVRILLECILVDFLFIIILTSCGFWTAQFEDEFPTRTRFWTLPNLNSEVSTPKILLFSYWFFMQIGWTAFTAWISQGIRLRGHFRINSVNYHSEI